MIALEYGQTVALAYGLAFLLMGCLGYVLGIVHARYEARRAEKVRRRELE